MVSFPYFLPLSCASPIRKQRGETQYDRNILLKIFTKTSVALLSADDVFSEVSDPAWMARLSFPLTSNYHDNVFVPNGPPSPESEAVPWDALDSSSFSTFGKCKKLRV